MAQRIFFGLLLIIGLAGVFWGELHFAASANHALLRSASFLPVAVLLLSLLGTRECLALASACGYHPIRWAVFMAVTCLHAAAGLESWIEAHSWRSGLEWMLLMAALSLLVIAGAQVARRSTQGGFANMAVSIMIVLYMGVLPAMISLLRSGLAGTLGVWAVVLFVAVVKTADMGAYFTGKAVGRTKLIPSISPGKTVEGLVGGTVAAVVVAVALGRWLPWPASLGDHPIGWTRGALFGVVMAWAGQIGDLTESVLKRQAAVKDSATIIPSFGGVLDLLDSPVFAAPLAYLLLTSWLR